jgi:hypothetical protein
VETKTDDMGEIKLPGYKFHMKNRKTNSRVKSRGKIIGYHELLRHTMFSAKFSNSG